MVFAFFGFLVDLASPVAGLGCMQRGGGCARRPARPRLQRRLLLRFLALALLFFAQPAACNSASCCGAALPLSELESFASTLGAGGGGAGGASAATAAAGDFRRVALCSTRHERMGLVAAEPSMPWPDREGPRFDTVELVGDLAGQAVVDVADEAQRDVKDSLIDPAGTDDTASHEIEFRRRHRPDFKPVNSRGMGGLLFSRRIARNAASLR